MLSDAEMIVLLTDARQTIAFLRSCIDSGERLNLKDRGDLIAISDRLSLARDALRGFRTGPMVSPGVVAEPTEEATCETCGGEEDDRFHGWHAHPDARFHPFKPGVVAAPVEDAK